MKKITFFIIIVSSVFWVFYFEGSRPAQSNETTNPLLQAYSPDKLIQGPEFVPGELIVKFKPQARKKTILSNEMKVSDLAYDKQTLSRLDSKYGARKIKSVFKRQGNRAWLGSIGLESAKISAEASKRKNSKRPGKLPENINVPDLENIFRLEIDKEADVEKVAEEYSSDQAIEYAEPNYQYYPDYVPSDMLYSSQWSHQNIDSEVAWDLEKGSSNTIIAIIDSGVDYEHADLKTNININPSEIPENSIDDDQNGYIDDNLGWDFFGNDNDPMPLVSHGTHCSGIAASIGNNEVGVIGLCPKCKIMPLKITESGPSDALKMSEAIKYAADNGASVISISWGGPSISEAVKDAIAYAEGLGVVIVASAGNDNKDAKHYPSSHEGVLSIASTTVNNIRSSFSNWGGDVDVAAPGSSILSTLPGNQYGSMSGTSMSTPLVSGLAGLLLSNQPSLSKMELENIIINEVDEFGVDVPASDHYIGKGIINADKALKAAGGPAKKAEIADPMGGKLVGTKEIIGTADGEYALEIGSGFHPDSWQTLNTGNNPIKEGSLASLNTSRYADGIYTLRLTVDSLAEEETDTVNIEVGNANIQFEEPNTQVYYGFGYTVPIRISSETMINSCILEYASVSDPENWSSSGFKQSLSGNLVTGSLNTASLPGPGEYLLRARVFYNDFESAEVLKIELNDIFQSGWPQRIDDVQTLSSLPLAADIDNDNDKEVVANGMHKIYAWNSNGSLQDGWPQNVSDHTEQYEGITSKLAIGDIDGDKKSEIVACTNNYLIAYNHDGSVVEGFPIDGVDGNCKNPVIYDMRGEKKILVAFSYFGTVTSKNDELRVYNSDGTRYEDFSGAISGTRITAPPAYGEVLKGVPGKEIALNYFDDTTATGYLTLLDSYGNTLPNWPRGFQGSPTSIIHVPPIMGEIDGRDGAEIFSAPIRGKLYAFDSSGNILPGWDTSINLNYLTALAMGDLNADSKMELIAISISSRSIYSIDISGKATLKGILPHVSQSGVSVGDLNGDGRPDALAGYGSIPPNSKSPAYGQLQAFYGTNTESEGWPKFAGLTVDTTPTITDLDGDGDVEVISVSTGATGVLVFDLPAKYDAATVTWPMYQHDPEHTGFMRRAGYCELAEAFWIPNTLTHEESATLMVQGEECDGKTIRLHIKEMGRPAEDSIAMLNAKFDGDTAITNWITPKNGDLTDNTEYYFNVEDLSVPFSKTSSLSNNNGVLSVKNAVKSQDINYDNSVNIKDIQAVIRCIINPACGVPRADVSGDGKVNIKDIQAIIREIVNSSQ